MSRQRSSISSTSTTSVVHILCMESAPAPSGAMLHFPPGGSLLALRPYEFGDLGKAEATYALSWSLSRKRRNRAVHALHGKWTASTAAGPSFTAFPDLFYFNKYICSLCCPTESESCEQGSSAYRACCCGLLPLSFPSPPSPGNASSPSVDPSFIR